jgi:hypothetical protein
MLSNQHYPAAVISEQIPTTLPINNSAFSKLFWVPKNDIIKIKEDNLNYLAQHINPNDYTSIKEGLASNSRDVFEQETKAFFEGLLSS